MYNDFRQTLKARKACFLRAAKGILSFIKKIILKGLLLFLNNWSLYFFVSKIVSSVWDGNTFVWAYAVSKSSSISFPSFLLLSVVFLLTLSHSQYSALPSSLSLSSNLFLKHLHLSSLLSSHPFLWSTWPASIEKNSCMLTPLRQNNELLSEPVPFHYSWYPMIEPLSGLISAFIWS